LNLIRVREPKRGLLLAFLACGDFGPKRKGHRKKKEKKKERKKESQREKKSKKKREKKKKELFVGGYWR